MIWSWFEDVHIFWILSSYYFTYCFKLNLVVFRHLLVAISDTLYLVCANSPTIICWLFWNFTGAFVIVSVFIYFSDKFLSLFPGCEHRQPMLSIENTRWVSFDIKFTRQGFENACWHREACRAIQHAFSKPSLVNLISKDANLVFYLSVNPSLNTLQTSDYDVIFDFCVDSVSFVTSFKSATSSWPDKGNMPCDRKRLLGYVETV